jgi:hypothetical protein
MNKLRLTTIFSGFVIALMILPMALRSATWYVNQAAAGANTGVSWDNAFTSLTSALNAASFGDHIWVAQGVYKPEQPYDLNESGGADPREAVFMIPDGVKLYGGFTGTETQLNERNWEVNLTILSGDIDNNDENTDGNFIAETWNDIVGLNAYHVVLTENVGPETRVDGFVITGGSANIGSPINFNDPNLSGGGWYNRISPPANFSSPTIANTVFSGNYAESGGGAFFTNSGPAGAQASPDFEKCIFTGNKSNNAGGAIQLGSFSPGTYQPVFKDCEFKGNTAFRRGGAIHMIGDQAEFHNTWFENNSTTAISEDLSTLPGQGGAVSLVSSNALFVNSQFHGNSSTGNPTGFFEGGGGGAVYMSTNDPQTSSLGESSPTFISCGFYNNSASDNTAAWGGAIVHLCDGGRLLPQYVNCVFYGNQAQNHGGAIANFSRVLNEPDGFVPALNPWFTNCTFVANHAGQNGGAIFNSGYPLDGGGQMLNSRLENTILWVNTATAGNPQIFNTGNNFIAYSLIGGSGGSGAGWNATLGTDGGNNLDVNPNFVNQADPLGPDNIPGTTDDGLRQGMSSLVINAGNNAAPGLSGITTDYTGGQRIIGSQVDMGAYERSGIFIPELDIFWLREWVRIDPPCFTCPPPWAVFLNLIPIRVPPRFLWDGPAQLQVYDDYALITGKLINEGSPKMSFNVNIKLDKPQDWNSWSKSGGTYFALTKESMETALKEHQNWTFWRLSEDSYIEGTGEIKGKLYLRTAPPMKRTGFQLGKGANGWDGDLGIGGYFFYKGRVEYKGRTFTLAGRGSVNTDAEPCESDCIPIDISAAPMEAFLKNLQWDETSDDSFIKLFPTPARDYISVQSDMIHNEGFTLTIFDMAGRVVYSENVSSEDLNKRISISSFKPGTYLLRIMDLETGHPQVRQFVKE